MVCAVYAFCNIGESWPNGEPPALVTETVMSGVEGKGRDVVGIDGVADKAAGRVRVEGDEEEEGEMVGVPERLEGLATDCVMCSCVDEEHEEEHGVAGDAASLGVVDVEGSLCTKLCGGWVGEFGWDGGGDLRESSMLKKLT